MSITLTPRGAIKGPSRAEAEGIGRRYIHQRYPSIRHHPDGSTRTVNNIQEDGALGEPWSDVAYPPVVAAAAIPEPTIAELKAMVDAQAKKIADLEAVCAERITEVNELRLRKPLKAVGHDGK